MSYNSRNILGKQKRFKDIHLSMGDIPLTPIPNMQTNLSHLLFSKGLKADPTSGKDGHQSINHSNQMPKPYA